MMGRVGWLLLSLAVLSESQTAEEFCEGKVQAAVDNLKQCRVAAGITDAVDNGCGCDGEEDRKKKDCEWASKIGVISYVNAMANVCSQQGVNPPNLTIAQPTTPDTCVPEMGFYQKCLTDHNIAKSTPTFNKQECECVVPVHNYLRTIAGKPCVDILAPYLAATDEYHVAEGACANCSSQLLCLPIEETVEDSPFYDSEVRLKTQAQDPYYLEDDKELLRGSIAHYAEVANSQVHFFKVERVQGDKFSVWFMLLGLPLNTTEATQGKLEAAIEGGSVLSTNYQMTQMKIVNEPFREVVVTEDEVPAWMIVLLVLSLTALVVAAVGGAFMFLTGKGDGGEEEEEEDEEGEDNVQMSERGDEETGEPVRDLKPLPAGDDELRK